MLEIGSAENEKECLANVEARSVARSDLRETDVAQRPDARAKTLSGLPCGEETAREEVGPSSQDDGAEGAREDGWARAAEGRRNRLVAAKGKVLAGDRGGNDADGWQPDQAGRFLAALVARHVDLER